jgi:hypothetical protein
MAYVAIAASAPVGITTSTTSTFLVGGSYPLLANGPLQLGQYLYLLRCDQATWYAQGPNGQSFPKVPVGNTFTIANHGFVNGTGPVQCSTTGTLPGGLSPSTNYWLIVIDPNTFAFAASYAQALTGNQITITSSGTGIVNPLLGVQSTAGSAGCSLAQPSQEVIVDGRLGVQVAVVQDTTPGRVTICQATWVR